MPIQRRLIVHASGALAAATLGFPGLAAAWPNRPLRIVVPFAAGGTSDVIARLISKPLGDALGGVTVVVENKTGANGIIGAAATAQASDEHTLLLTDMSVLAINPLVS